jgi:CBS domain containing-hemolysin-like protein
LDKILGDEVGNILSKSKMKRLFEQYEKNKFLLPAERKMLSAALELHEKIAGQVMTPLDKTFMLDINSNFDENLLKTIYT